MEDIFYYWSKILRASPEDLKNLDSTMSALFNQRGVLEKLYSENQELISDRLRKLGLKGDEPAEKILNSLLGKIKSDDEVLFQLTGKPDISNPQDASKIVSFIKELGILKKGYFLKTEKAKEMMLKNPPPQTLKVLGYQNGREMIEKEDIFELYASLRFLEEEEWLNNVFFKEYENLTFDDFEYRPIEIRVLSLKWAGYAEKFVAKKYHNISHLKELGLVFVIPIKLNVSGEFLRMFSLIIHYLNEISFYNDIFVGFSKENQFSRYFIEALKGKMLEEKPASHKTVWLIIQQYLAKKNENDWRLFTPHLNPEVIHWEKAEEVLSQINKEKGGLGLDFYLGLNWVGDYFKNQKGNEELVSFNLIDVVMSLVKYKTMTKYVYHHQEALWNKIFVSYADGHNLEKLIKDNWLKGYIELG